MSIIQRNDPEYLKERTKILKLQIAHKKAEKELLETMITAEPAMQSFTGFLNAAKDLDPGFMESLSNFVGIAKGAFQEGLSDALTKLNNTLFSEDGINAMNTLGNLGGKLVGLSIEDTLDNVIDLDTSLKILNITLDNLNKSLDPEGKQPFSRPLVPDTDGGGATGTIDINPIQDFFDDLRRRWESIELFPGGPTIGDW